MALSRRYTPAHHPADQVSIGLDFSPILPPGIGIVPFVLDPAGNPTPRLEIWANYNPPATAATDWTVDPSLAQEEWFWSNGVWAAGTGQFALGVGVSGRAVYAVIQGGADGIDYQLRWTVTDTLNNIWTRTALMQCSVTS